MLFLDGNLPFSSFDFVFEGNFQVQAPLHMEGGFNGRVFCVTSLGSLYLEGLICGGAYFRNFAVANWLNSNKAC